MIFLIAFLSFFLYFSVLYIARMYLAGGRLSRGDTFFHLLLSAAIRQNKLKFPSSLPNITLCEIDKNYDYLAYPPLFHYIVALFPIKFHENLAKYFNLVIISLIGSLGSVLFYNFTSNITYSILCGFIVITNFCALSLVVQFSPRALGILFYTLIICLSIFYSMSPLLLLLTSFLVVALSLTHKFALQVLIFGLLPYTIIFNQLLLLLPLVLGIVLSILITKGFYLNILKEHIRWLRFYRVRPFRAPIKTYLVSIFGSNIWIFFIMISLFLILSQNNLVLTPSLLTSNIFSKVIFWSFINILISLVISIPTLSFLGEFSRYIEYSIVPVGLASTLLIVSLNPYFLLISIACVFLSLVALSKYKRYLDNSKALIDKDDISAYFALKDHGLNNVLVFPARTLEVSYFSGIDVIHPVRGAETPIEQITHLVENYRISYVLKFKDSDPYQLFATMAKMKRMEKILNFKNFEIYKINSYQSHGN